jgi:hypothetical protein
LTNEVKYGNQSPQFDSGVAVFLIKMKYNLILYRPPCGIFKITRLLVILLGKVSCDRSIGE